MIAVVTGCGGQRLNRETVDVPAHKRPAERDCKATETYDPSDWAWEFLRRNPDYRTDWRSAVPRRLPHVTLSDGTQMLRLRRRYPRAEQWGLYAFADPLKAAQEAPVFWLASANSRLIRARCAQVDESCDHASAPLAAFKVSRFAAIGVDGIPVVTLKGQGTHVALELHGLAVLTQPSRLVFELDGLDDLNGQMERLKTLQRFTKPQLGSDHRPPFGCDERLHHALIALDESMAGKSYRQIAIAIYGEKRVAEEWGGTSQFLKDRARRLVAKGHELMTGGYRDLLA
ncbi:DNA -binding domain-containing protein [Bradyrhizobium sp. TZ2]